MFLLIFGHLVFLLACSEIHTQTLLLDHRVSVSLAGEDVKIDMKLVQQVNESGGLLKCFNPRNIEIYHKSFGPSALNIITGFTVHLKHVLPSHSGEYHCWYKKAQVYWILLVRDEGYKEPKSMSSYNGLIGVGVLTFVLLLFSVIGSVYVFSGYWANKTQNAEANSSSEAQRERRKEEEEHDDTDVTAPSTSFYASLEPRPGSIYEVLDHSASNVETSQRKVIHKSKERDKPVDLTHSNQHDGVFESVYENL